MLYHQTHNSVGNYAYNAYIYDDVEYLPHFHRNFELVYVISGFVRCTAGDRCAVLGEGDFGLFLSNEVHSLLSEGHSRCWVGVFSGDFAHAFEKQTRGKVGERFVFRCEKSIEDYLASNLLKETVPPVYLLKSCLYAACHEFSRQIPLHSQVGKSGMLMRSITDYISENYQNRITLSDMAQSLGYNYHYLSKCFHRIFNMSFTAFLNSYRFEAALELLIETDREIGDLALESGFQSVRNFNDYFRARTGTTPVRYRADNGKIL